MAAKDDEKQLFYILISMPPKIEFKDNVSLSDSLKTVNLEVVDRGYIKKIYTALTNDFSSSGINVKFSPSNNIGISLATVNHVNKDKFH